MQRIEPRLRAEAADEAAQCNWFIAGAAARPRGSVRNAQAAVV
jgi:hypothetical protein